MTYQDSVPVTTGTEHSGWAVVYEKGQCDDKDAIRTERFVQASMGDGAARRKGTESYEKGGGGRENDAGDRADAV